MPELRRSTRVASKAVTDPAPWIEEPVKKKPKTSAKSSEPTTPKQPELEVGDSIPDITLLDEEENEINLVEASKKSKYLIIFAYPKASTPGCTRQVCGFQANYDFLKSSGATMFGLSADQPKSQKNFVVKQNLKYPLLSDPSKKLIGVLGAKKSPSGIKRSHWIFVDGVLKVKKIQISPEASINTAKEDVEEFIKNDVKLENGEEKPDPNASKESVNNVAKEETKVSNEASKVTNETSNVADEASNVADANAILNALHAATDDVKEEVAPSA